MKGPTLLIVGSGLIPDVYQKPFHSLNFAIDKKLGKEDRARIDFNVSNILNDKRESTFQSFRAEDRIFNSINPATSFRFIHRKILESIKRHFNNIKKGASKTGPFGQKHQNNEKENFNVALYRL